MPMFTSHAAGSPCWVDLMSPDVEASKAFYGAVFGWAAEDQLDGEGNYTYTMFSQDGRSVAGMGGQGPDMAGMPPVWSTYVAVDDPSATAEKVTAAGGTVMMPPMQVMEAGEMAIFADPTGAVFSVWKAGEHAGAEITNEPDTWSWNELMTRDIDAALAFYTEVFGWSYERMDMGPAGTYNVIAGGENNGLGGLMPMPAEMPDMVPNHWAVYFTVADLQASLAKVTEAGGMVANGPMEIPGIGTSAVIHDPAGGSFVLMQPADQG